MSVLGREHIWKTVGTVGFVAIALYAAEFSIKQSVVVAFCLLLVIEYAAELASPAHGFISRATRFQPYYVQIWPNWFRLLADFKIIESDTEWEKVSQSLEKTPSGEYRILRSGLRYTVLNERERGSLVYWNNHHVFQTGIDLWEDLAPVGIEPDEEHEELERVMSILNDRGGKAPIQFFCKLGLIDLKTVGYLLGFIVPDWWWEKNRSACPKPIQEDRGKVPLTGQVKITVAVIPYSEFLAYEGTWNERASLKLDQECEQFGWKREERDTEDRLLGAPESIKHNYFTVEHREI
jgi:hypothetical protein